MSSTLKSIIQYGVITLIGIFFLYFVFNGTDWNDLFVKFRQTNYWWIGAGMFAAIFSHGVRGYRATMMYEALHYKVPVKNSVYAVLIGYMMNYFIPRAGEVSRCAALTRTDGVPVDKSLGTVVTERIFDMVILLFIIALVFVLNFDMLMGFMERTMGAGTGTQTGPNIKLMLLCIVGMICLVLFLFRKRLAAIPVVMKVMNLLKGFGEGLLSIRNVKNPVLFVFLSVLIWFCYIVMMYFCLFAMEATKNLNFTDCLTVFAIGSIGMIIPAPGAGAGTYHFAVMQSLLIFGVAEADGIAYATIVHGVQMVLLLVLGAICSLLVLRSAKKKGDPVNQTTANHGSFHIDQK